MYLVGSDHPNKETAHRLLEEAIARRERLVTNAEVFQEILHRYVAIARRDAISPAFEALKNLVDEIFPVSETTVLRAREIVLGYPGLSARDAIHIATMEQEGIGRIVTFDRGFEGYPGIDRIA